MAERPIYIQTPDSPELVQELFLTIKWHPGFAQSHKEKNIEALHGVAAQRGIAPLLEISSKSKTDLGWHLVRFT